MLCVHTSGLNYTKARCLHVQIMLYKHISLTVCCLVACSSVLLCVRILMVHRLGCAGFSEEGLLSVCRIRAESIF